MRLVIIHYHIFKNAGSTLDSMLERAFGDQWVNYDKGQAAAFITPEEMGAFIQAHPALRAVSSHHAVLPVPVIPGVQIIPALFFRHPLDRARSVYDFERRQGQEQGPVSKGAEHAARLSFQEYMRWRLDTTTNGVVHNFQTVRMIFHPRFNRHQISEGDFNEACARVSALPFFGIVEQFTQSTVLLRTLLASHGIAFQTDYEVRNRTAKKGSTLDERLAVLRAEMGESMWNEMVERNKWDLRLFESARKEFSARLARLGISDAAASQVG